MPLCAGGNSPLAIFPVSLGELRLPYVSSRHTGRHRIIMDIVVNNTGQAESSLPSSLVPRLDSHRRSHKDVGQRE